MYVTEKNGYGEKPAIYEYEERKKWIAWRERAYRR
jgi:hypothetical protein